MFIRTVRTDVVDPPQGPDDPLVFFRNALVGMCKCYEGKYGQAVMRVNVFLRYLGPSFLHASAQRFYFQARSDRFSRGRVGFSRSLAAVRQRSYVAAVQQPFFT
jgi:hypothetical protein